MAGSTRYLRTIPGIGWIASLFLGLSVHADPSVVICRGLANASGAVRVGEHRILVGSDDNNALLLYDARTGGDPIQVFPMSRWLGLSPSDGSVDFEGAARVGDVVYWIGSHARNKNGKSRPERQRLLGLRVSGEDAGVQLTPVARPVTTLLDSLVTAPALSAFHLGEASRRAPESPGGLNIEGLSATPDGGLWIGFRSPVPAGKALLAPLLNPADVMDGKPARWGNPAQVDLGDEKGVRDLVWTGRDYFVLGGNAGDGGKTRLFRWAGPGSEAMAVKVPGLKELNPEALVMFGTPEKPRVLILSDDGNRTSNETRDPTQRTFRMLWVEPSMASSRAE